MHKHILARLAADKAVALGVVEPLYCSLFHILVLLFLCCSYAGGSRKKNLRRLLAVEARSAHYRVGLTYSDIVLSPRDFSKRSAHTEGSRAAYAWPTAIEGSEVPEL
jgi:hypothetical protein